MADNTPGVEGGKLVDPRAYFFHVIGRTEGAPAPDWKAVLESLPGRGMGTNPRPGERQPAGAPFGGLTVMIDAGGHARGRIWLPTQTPNIDQGNAWFTHEIQVIADGPTPGSFVWAWQDKGGAEYTPVPMPADEGGGGEQPGGGTTPGGGGAGSSSVDAAVQALVAAAVAPLLARIAALEARPAGGGGSTPLTGRLALRGAHGRFLTAEGGGAVTNRETEPAAWQEWEVVPR